VKESECALHPLIHIPLRIAQAQDVEKKKAEPRTPHFVSLNQDIVGWSQGGKCELKYEILSPTRKVGEFVLSLDARFLPGFGNLR